MIFEEETSFDTGNTTTANSNEMNNNSRGPGFYKELLGLNYPSNQTRLIPKRFKWGRAFIQVVG